MINVSPELVQIPRHFFLVSIIGCHCSKTFLNSRIS